MTSNHDPIFIVGVPRSGTTLLAAMMGSHTELFALPETHIFSHLFGEKISPVDVLATKDSALDFLCSITRFGGRIIDDLAVNRVHLASQLPEGRLQVQDLLSALAGACQGRDLHKRYIEKTPDHLLYVRSIRRFFPESKVIRIIRDPRDVAYSLIKVPWSKANDLETALSDIRLRMSHTEAFFSKDKLSITVRYEDLLDNAEACLTKLSSFCDINYQPDMLNFQKTANSIIASGESWKEGAASELTKSNAGVYRSLMSRAEKSRSAILMFDILRRYGYDTSDASLFDLSLPTKGLRFTRLVIGRRKRFKKMLELERQKWQQLALEQHHSLLAR